MIASFSPYAAEGMFDYLDLDLYQNQDIAIVAMNRFKQDKRMARQAANHLDNVLIQQLISAFKMLERDPAVKSIILTSAHRMAFSRGAKIEVIIDMSLQGALEIVANAQQLILVMQKLKKPIVAALNGLTLGGGLEVAMACDYRIAGDRATVVFGLPEGSLGILPGMGGTQNLPRLVGKEKAASYMISAGADIQPDVGLQEGLLDAVVDYQNLIAEAVAFIQSKPLSKAMDLESFKDPSISREVIREEIKNWLGNCPVETNPAAKSAPLSQALIHFVTQHTALDKYMDALVYEQEAFSYLVTTSDAQEGVKALIEGRDPVFQGR